MRHTLFWNRAIAHTVRYGLRERHVRPHCPRPHPPLTRQKIHDRHLLLRRHRAHLPHVDRPTNAATPVLRRPTHHLRRLRHHRRRHHPRRAHRQSRRTSQQPAPEPRHPVQTA